MIHKHAIATIGEVERDVFVGLLAAGAAILVPAIDSLPVLDEGGEALAQAIHGFAHAQRQLLVYEAPAVGLLDIAHPARLAAGEHAPAIAAEFDAPGAAARHPCRQPPAAQAGRVVAQRGVNIARRLLVQRKLGAARLCAGKMRDPHLDHIVHRRREGNRKQRAVQRVATFGNARAWRINRERIGRDRGVVGFGGVGRRDAGPQQPVSIGEFHGCSFCVCGQ